MKRPFSYASEKRKRKAGLAKEAMAKAKGNNNRFSISIQITFLRGWRLMNAAKLSFSSWLIAQLAFVLGLRLLLDRFGCG
ncbi:hypothetical protein TNCT_383041 [Trichonephila clavata]|uniref:Uncharacterized protein n=1 Tax=Trichonephila clavata TaxID=2740835 RepID=A0A8X6HUV6_TRICU|nr:hypothetical protein TNCT_383041 [Trichonephila clavata]